MAATIAVSGMRKELPRSSGRIMSYSDGDNFKAVLFFLAVAGYVGYLIGKGVDPHPLYDENAKVWRFDQFICTEPACTDHVLGYQWAKEHIDDKCPKRSKSFYEGCRLFIEGYEEYLRESDQFSPGDYEG